MTPEVFNIGDVVFYRMDSEKKGLVTGTVTRPNAILYYVTWGHDMIERGHYAMELSSERDFSPLGTSTPIVR